MLAAAALHCRPQLQLKTDSAQQSADCRVIKVEMAVFTRGESQVALTLLIRLDSAAQQIGRSRLFFR